MLPLSVGFPTGFTAEAGETLVISYSTFSFDATEVTIGGFLGLPIPPVLAELNPVAGTITITFNEDFESGSSLWGLTLNIEGVPIPNTLCNPNSETRRVDVYFVVEGGGQTSAISIESNEPCGVDEDNPPPYVSNLMFSPVSNKLSAYIAITDSNSATDKTVTVTWPTGKLSVAPGTYQAVVIQAGGEEYYRVPISIVAVVADGQMTITFENLPPNHSYLIATVSVDAVLTTSTCDADGGLYQEDPGFLWVYADPAANDGAFPIPVQSVLCNAAGASINGELSPDGTHITWTFSSGDVLGSSRISMLAPTLNQTLDCESVSLQSDSQTGVPDCDPGSDGTTQSAGYSLEGYPSTSGTMTMVTEILDPSVPQTFMACGIASPSGGISLMAEGESTAGQGVYICTEVFSAGAADAVTASFDREVVEVGDTVTLTINATSTSLLWDTSVMATVGLDPYEVLDVECTFAPEGVTVGVPCTIGEDGNLYAEIWQDVTSESPEPGSAPEISVVITARLAGEPGSSHPVKACFTRGIAFVNGIAMVDSIGGETCADAPLSIAPAVPTETPTPSPTATPTETPSPTSTSTPEQKETRVRVETSDGSSLEGANWSLFAPIASQQGEGPYLTGALDAANTALLIDVPAGEYRFVVAPDGVAPQEFMITITNESQDIVVQFAAEGTPAPTDPATPGQTATADPTATSSTGVSGLPETGNGSGSGIGFILIAAMAASMLALAGIGLRSRSTP